MLYPRSHLVMQQKRSREHKPPCMGAKTKIRISSILRNLGLKNPRVVGGHPALIGMSDLRHSRITYAENVEKMSCAERDALATRMLHTRRCSDLYVRKKGEGTARGSDSLGSKRKRLGSDDDTGSDEESDEEEDLESDEDSESEWEGIKVVGKWKFVVV